MKTLFKPGQTYWCFHVETGQGWLRDFNPLPEGQEYWKPLQENINIWNFKTKDLPHHWAYGVTREEAIQKLMEYREYLNLPTIHPMQFYP